MALDAQRRQRLADMGIVHWRRRQPQSDVVEPAANETRTIPAAAAGELEILKQQVRGCELCELHRTRTQTVFGNGSPQAELFIVGEAPGADEDAQGEPFVGRAGQLLNSMLAAIGLQREQVYIANILKCRPPGNRDPKPEEVASTWIARSNWWRHG